MTKVIDRFLRYIAIDTQSKEDQDVIPSTQKQWKLARLLEEELKAMGAADVEVDGHAYVYATIPATSNQALPVLGFIAHMDTSPDYSGEGVRPQVAKNYAGGPILLNPSSGLAMEEKDFPFLAGCKGLDLVTTDGTTLLGADDKAGVAEIMAMAEHLLSNPSIPHGTIKIGFTPDEEVGHGADLFNLEKFGADVAYTVDGGPLGELEYENFNAASATVLIHGKSIHPGSAKGKMKNAILMGMELQAMLPAFENPMYTEGYEGFYHLHHFNGNLEQVSMKYLLRDHDMERFLGKKEMVVRAAGFLNFKYGAGTVEVEIKDTYYNMKEKLENHMHLISIAKAAMEELGITPLETPIRGGTDGARLSYMGLPCPNLSTGGYNFHGRYECIPIQSIERMVDVLVGIVGKFADDPCPPSLS